MHENAQTLMVKYIGRKKNTEKTLTKNTQTSMAGKKHGQKTQKNMDKKYTKFTKKNKTLLVEKKNPRCVRK